MSLEEIRKYAGSAREVTNAEEEGIEFVWLSSPKGLSTNKIEKLIVDRSN